MFGTASPAIKTYQITLLGTGDTFLCREGEHVLLAMSKVAKKGIPSGCHGGGCGVCKVQITSGDYATKVMSRAYVTEAEEALGCALACRVLPKSNLSIDVIGKLQKSVLKYL